MRRLGVHKGALAAANVAQWALATYDLGHVPTVVEYAEYWAIAERTGWLHGKRAADVFGKDEWRSVVEAVAAEITQRRSPRAVMALPLPASVAV